jgi:hypothetical protein
MSNTTPQWVKDLVTGDDIVVCFPYTGNSIFAEVVKNHSKPETGSYGAITIRYLWKGVAREEDLLYVDYNKSEENQNNWYAYHVT